MKLIAITGLDGTGKSTLCRNVCRKFPKFRTVSIWDTMDGSLFHTKKDIDTYLCTLSANARLLFLSHALMQALDKALKSDAETLVLDGYYYKYFASELALGANATLVKKLMEAFPVPDLVIKLVSDPTVSYAQKDMLSSYECGLQTPSLEKFKAFQERVAFEFQQFERTNWKTIPATLAIDEVFSQFLKFIDR